MYSEIFEPISWCIKCLKDRSLFWIAINTRNYIFPEEK